MATLRERLLAALDCTMERKRPFCENDDAKRQFGFRFRHTRGSLPVAALLPLVAKSVPERLVVEELAGHSAVRGVVIERSLEYP